MESALLHAASASATQSLSFLDIALWVVLPYVSFAILIVGLAWRYKTDQYGWTSRSSQWNEPTILRCRRCSTSVSSSCSWATSSAS